jgi:hypothetical protein
LKNSSRLGFALMLAAGCASAAQAPPAVGPLVVLAGPPGDGKRFVGSASCRACHPAAYSRWRATGHAREFAGLPPADRTVPACLRCHVTGYGDPLGYQLAGAAPELGSVGCEACHGAGAEHARSAHPGLVPTATGGECPPCEVNRICRLCHTPDRSAAFDLARALERVVCGEGSRGRR